MALTAEQQAQVDYDNAARAVERRMEAIRLAKETLIENDRSKSVEERGVSSADIIQFATDLETYVNQ